MPDEPRWGPSTTYRSSPQLRRAGARRPVGGDPDDGDGLGGAGLEGAGLEGAGRGAPRPAGVRGAGSRGARVAASYRSASVEDQPVTGQRGAVGRTGQRPAVRTGARPAVRSGTGTGQHPAVGRGGPGEHPARPPMSPARRRGLGRLVGLLVVLAVLAVLAYPVLLGRAAYTSVHRFGALPASTVADTPGRTVLLVGSDSRAGLTRDQKVALSTGDADGGRTDTIMLLHKPSNGGPTVLLSIPRDSYVAIPGHGHSKINAAYSWGGPALMVTTVEQATGIHIDGYAETGLGGFAGLVDAVGGVTMCPKTAINDVKAGLNIPAGCQHMDGATALGYARSRDFDPNGDLGRAERQRQLIAAIAAKAAKPSVLADPFKAFPLARAGGSALTVDDSFGPSDMLSFVRAMKQVSSGGAVSLNVPVATTTAHTSAGLSILWDTAKAQRVFNDIRTNNTADLRAIAATEPAVQDAAANS